MMNTIFMCTITEHNEKHHPFPRMVFFSIITLGLYLGFFHLIPASIMPMLWILKNKYMHMKERQDFCGGIPKGRGGEINNNHNKIPYFAYSNKTSIEIPLLQDEAILVNEIT
ncbi:hypothetical protein AB1K84_00385 [Mesobacillus foraminis]|uniref:hypothetical protein n=1 Tax=Mesobacillus foraminis TaxID=279826 RepID=UPI0039A0DF36